VDRELAEALPYLPQLPLSDLAAARAGFAELVAQAPPPDRSGVRVEDRTVPGPQGARTSWSGSSRRKVVRGHGQVCWTSTVAGLRSATGTSTTE